MFWCITGHIADILGILSFLLSSLVFIFSRSLFRNMKLQKTEYNSERIEIQTTLEALRKNIWLDRLDSIKIRSQMRQALYSYFNKYWSISPPRCLFHLLRSIHYSKHPIQECNKEKLCISLDYLIAYLNKKEAVLNE